MCAMQVICAFGCVLRSVYMCVCACACLHGHVCVIGCVSREKQIHLSFLDRDARNTEEGEIVMQERLREEGEPNGCPYKLSPCRLPPSRCSLMYVSIFMQSTGPQSRGEVLQEQVVIHIQNRNTKVFIAVNIMCVLWGI